MKTSKVDRLTRVLGDWLQFRARQQLIPGFSVAVFSKNKMLYSGAFGHAELDPAVKLTSSHAFCVGSQSKMLTAVLTLQLAEAGTLQLHDPVRHYLPWLMEHHDRRLHAMTIEQLLRHAAGLARDGDKADFWLGEQPFPTKQGLRQLILNACYVESRAASKYSNLGYALLGQVLEASTGRTYEELAMAHIIKPLRLQETWAGYSTAHSVPLGYGAAQHGARRSARHHLAPHTYHAVTGWYSTPADMSRIMQALYAHELVAPASLNMITHGRQGHWRPYNTARGFYGLGFMRYSNGDHTLGGHGGGCLAHRSGTYFDEGHDIGVSIAANSTDAPIMDMAVGVLEVARHAYYSAPESWQKFEGVFENFLSTRMIIASKDRLISVPLDDWQPFADAEILLPVDDSTLQIVDSHFFAAPQERIHYAFQQKQTGAVAHINYAGCSMYPKDS